MLSKQLSAATALFAIAVGSICVTAIPAARAGRVDAEDYGRAAHKYATFIIARRSGLSSARSHRLSFFSQFPDDEYCLNAITAPNQTLRKRDVIHSLHGGGHGAVHKRRSDLRSLIRHGIESRELSDFQLGIIIHAHSDAYSHTFRRDGRTRAFGPAFGHGNASILSSLSSVNKDPDLIADFPGKFKRYACDLFTSLSSGHRSCRRSLGRLLALVDDLTPGTFDELPRMRALAGRYGFSARRYNAIAKKHRISGSVFGRISTSCTGNIPQSTMFSVIRLMEEEFDE